MRVRRAAYVVVSMVLTCSISACGGSSSNDVASKSASGIVSAAVTAVSGAHSAHISGSVASAGVPISLNLSLVTGKGGRGHVSQGGLRFKIYVIGNEVYLKGSPTFWRRLRGAAAARLLHGKWGKAPASGQFALFAQLGSLHALLGTLLPTHSVLVKSGSSTIDGQSAVGVRDATNQTTLYVATTGTPYPLEIVSSQTGRLMLNRFNESVSLTPPAGAIDISHLK